MEQSITMEQELKPCPFCGNAFLQQVWIPQSMAILGKTVGGYTIMCDCGITNMHGAKSAEEAREKWNTRVIENG